MLERDRVALERDMVPPVSTCRVMVRPWIVTTGPETPPVSGLPMLTAAVVTPFVLPKFSVGESILTKVDPIKVIWDRERERESE